MGNLPSYPVAVRCRSGFTHVVAAYKSERWYVRIAMKHATNIVFFKDAGNHPILLLKDFDTQRKPSPGLSEQMMINSVTIEAHSGRRWREDADRDDHAHTTNEHDATIISLEPEPDTDSAPTADQSVTTTPHFFSGQQADLDALKTWLDSQAGTPSDNSITHHTKPTLVGTVLHAFSWRRTEAQSTLEHPPQPVAFDRTRFRNKTSYIKGVSQATAFISEQQAAYIRMHFNIMLIPLTQIDDYDEQLEQHQLTIRWKPAALPNGTKQHVSVEEVINKCSALQRHPQLAATSYLITYGNVRLTMLQPITRESIRVIRETIGATDNVLIIPDKHLPSERRAAAWQAPTRTIFRPGADSAEPKDSIRRVIKFDAALPFDTIFKIAVHMKCEIIDARDDFVNTPMSFVAQWETKDRGHMEKLEETGVVVRVPGRALHIRCDVVRPSRV
jgi:hypothetical protein